MKREYDGVYGEDKITIKDTRGYRGDTLTIIIDEKYCNDTRSVITLYPKQVLKMAQDIIDFYNGTGEIDFEDLPYDEEFIAENERGTYKATKKRIFDKDTIIIFDEYYGENFSFTEEKAKEKGFKYYKK